MIAHMTGWSAEAFLDSGRRAKKVLATDRDPLSEFFVNHMQVSIVSVGSRSSYGLMRTCGFNLILFRVCS